MTIYILNLNVRPQEDSKIIAVEEDGSSKVIFKTKGCPDGVAIDPDNARIYWSDMGTVTNFKKGEFANRDGSINVLYKENDKWLNKVVCKGQIYTPKQIYFHQGWIYFGDREGLALRRVSAEGELQTLYVSGDPKVDMFDCTRQNVGCCVHDGYVYFSQKGPPKGGLGKILRLPLESKYSPEDRRDLEILKDKLPEPIDIAFGSRSGKIYWTDRGAPPEGNTLNRADIKSGKIVNHEIIHADFFEAVGLIVQSTEDKVFVSDLSGNIYKVDVKSRSRESIFDAESLVTGIESGPKL